MSRRIRQPVNTSLPDNSSFVSDNSAPLPASTPTELPKVHTISLKNNPYANWVYLAHAIDSWRIFPRIFFMTYNVLLYQVVQWYMDLAAPTMEQSGLVSVLVGAGAAWFGLYLGSSPKVSQE